MNSKEGVISNGLDSDILKSKHNIAPFMYSHLGAMASVGSWKGVYDSTNLGSATGTIDGPPVKGFLAFALWRLAYWTKQVTIQTFFNIL